MLALVAALQVVVAAQDTLPLVTLADALERAARLDPNYVAAVGQVDNAEWSRRAALVQLLVPAVTLSTTAVRSDGQLFTSFGTFPLRTYSTGAQVDLRFDLFAGGQKVQNVRATGAALEAARYGSLQQRFVTALETERDFYTVLTQHALERVADDQARRAEQQLAVARARVVSGAAVQTDSLQLVLVLTRARVDLLQARAARRVAQLEFGRRIGLAGPADAAPAPADTAPAPELPFSVADAVSRALAQGPAWRVARASERAASALLWSRRGQYLPQASLGYSKGANDTKFFPTAASQSALTLTVSLSLWDNGLREIRLSQARVNRDIARAVRLDLERSAWRDVTESYEAYNTSRATYTLQRVAVTVARENNRVQEARYRAGATTILDLLDAQNRLVAAEADLVQAMLDSRLARASLEVMLGERITFGQEPQ